LVTFSKSGLSYEARCILLQGYVYHSFKSYELITITLSVTHYNIVILIIASITNISSSYYPFYCSYCIAIQEVLGTYY
jgi:hypothetical protein